MNTEVESAAAYGTPKEEARQGVLAYLPIALFGSVMGLIGLSSAWSLASRVYAVPPWVAKVLAIVAIVAFVALTLAYLIKTVTAFAAVKAEFQHPIAGNLFGTFIISLLLLPIVLVPYSLALARGIWLLGMIAMVLFAWLIISRWLSQRQHSAHATPAWIVPVVGLIDIPLALPMLDWPWAGQIAYFSVAVGLFFAVPLFTLILSRLLFEDRLPTGLQPSLLIMLAPFAVGFNAYVSTFGEIDRFAGALYMLTLFLLVVLIGQLKNLAKSCPFRLSWWSVSFPLAAAAGCALRYAIHTPNSFTHAVAMLLLAFATLIIVGMSSKTLWAILKGDMAQLAK